MRAFMCDRCGNFYFKNKGVNIGYDTDRYLGGVNTVVSDGLVFKHYDLCDECIDDFMNFIKGPYDVEES